MARKPKECASCGCPRIITAKASVTIGDTTYGLNRLCIPCLLNTIELRHYTDKDKWDYAKAMKCHPLD